MNNNRKTLCLLIIIVLVFILSFTTAQAMSGAPARPSAGPQPDSSLSVHALTYSAGPLDNPLKGFLPYYDPANNYATAYPHSMEWSYIGLSEVMTNASNCNSYNWAVLEQILNGIAAHGNQAAIRFYIQFPGGTMGHPQDALPACLNAVVAMRWDNYNHINTPDYDNPTMVQALQNFISAFSAKYDGDSRIGYITMGLIGLWGEWHTWPYDGSNGYPNYFPTNTTVNAIMDPYVAAFHKTRLLVRQPYLGGGHAAQLPIGYHDDSWPYMEGSPLQSITLPMSMGGASYAYLQNALAANAENAWIGSAIGGEARPEIQSGMFNSWPGGNTAGQVSNLKASVELTHITWMINQTGITSYSSSDANVAAAMRLMGYELTVDHAYFNNTVTTGSSFKVGVQIENRGVARFYYPWTVIIGLKDGSGNVVKTWNTTWDITQVQPLQIRAFPDWNVGADPTYLPFGYPYYFDTTVSSTGVSSGTYNLVMRVQNPLESVNGSAKKLRFANTTQNTDGWLGLGTITLQIGTVPTNTPTSAVPTNTPQANATSGATTSYEAESAANTLAGGALASACTTCSGGQKVGYVGNNAGTLQFNGVSVGSSGIYSLRVYYINGDTTARSAAISVNGGSAVTLSFPATGSWTTVGSVATTITLNAGNNTILLSNPTVGSWAPDFDRITISGGTTPTNTPAVPTNTSVAPTATRTNTPAVPTNTSVAPTATRTNTPVPPTSTPVPPTTAATATSSGAPLSIDAFSDSTKWNNKLNDLNQSLSWVMDSAYYGANPPGEIVMNSGVANQYYQENVNQSLAGYTTLVLRLRDWNSGSGTEQHWNIVLNDATDHTVALSTYGIASGSYQDFNIPLSAFGASLANTKYMRIVHKDATYAVLLIDSISVR